MLLDVVAVRTGLAETRARGPGGPDVRFALRNATYFTTTSLTEIATACE